jgi:Uma2 family endonuclease
MPKIEPLLTVADLDATPDDGNRYELVEGELLVSRAPGLKHQTVVMNLSRELGNYLASNTLGMVFPGPGVVFSQYSAVIPDLVYVSRERLASVVSGERFAGAPDLIVEVVSPGRDNEDRDRAVKRQLYGKHGVAEYWIADPERASVEVYRLGETGLDAVAALGTADTLTTPLLPGFSVPVSVVFDFGLLQS